MCALALTLLGAGAAIAQQTQTQESKLLRFEVISVDGNDLVFRDQNGTRALTVPDDFRFTVDGKPVSVHDLMPGMKGTARVTTTTTVTPVYVTEVKKGTVVRQVGTSVHVRTADGVRWFKKADIDKRGVEIFMNGKPVKVTDLHVGDELTATIVTSAPPQVETAKDVQAALDAPEPAPPAPAEVPAAAPAPTPAPQPTAAATEPAPAAEPAAEPAATPAPPPVTTDAATKPEEPPADHKLLWIVLVLIVVIVAFLLMRRKRAET
jgi:hypothetical protein